MRDCSHPLDTRGCLPFLRRPAILGNQQRQLVTLDAHRILARKGRQPPPHIALLQPLILVRLAIGGPPRPWHTQNTRQVKGFQLKARLVRQTHLELQLVKAWLDKLLHHTGNRSIDHLTPAALSHPQRFNRYHNMPARPAILDSQTPLRQTQLHQMLRQTQPDFVGQSGRRRIFRVQRHIQEPLHLSVTGLLERKIWRRRVNLYPRCQT